MPPKPIANPYAKRKAPPSTTAAAAAAVRPSSNNRQQQQQQQQRPTQSTSTGTTHHTTAQSSYASTLPTGSTFSQAFQSIEDKPQYQQTAAQQQQQQQQQQQHQRPNQNTQEERAQQRALDQAQQLSDRDIQQFLTSTHLLVSPKQRGNAVLQYIRNVPWKESRMVPDYILGPTRCALFLSCKYHALHPHYIHRRIAELQSDFTLRILLVLVDEANADATLFQLNKVAVINNLTLILAWSAEEAARYLETYQAFVGNNKDASLIQKRKAEAQHFGDQVSDVLSKAAAAVNKTDAAQLLAQFGTVQALAAASVEELATVSGMGQVKVKRLHDAWHKPFSKRKTRQRKETKEAASKKESDDEELFLEEDG